MHVVMVINPVFEKMSNVAGEQPGNMLPSSTD